MFKACRKHINTGGDVELKSFSKCFILDLFKYITLYKQPDGFFAADVYVKKNADINIIQINNEIISLQKFILEGNRLENSEFAIDFSEPRNYKRENFHKWYKSFMETKFNDGSSKNPIESEQKSTEINNQDYLLKILLQSENSTQVSLMVSPVADREVVISGELEETVEFNPIENQQDACIHFSFSEEELFELIISYFVTFLKIHRDPVETDLVQSFRIDVLTILDKLQGLLNQEHDTDATDKFYGKIDIIKKIDAIKSIVELEATNKKVLALLKMIDWEYEKKYWDNGSVNKFVYKKIYNKSPENIFVNVIKCICIDELRGKNIGI